MKRWRGVLVSTLFLFLVTNRTAFYWLLHIVFPEETSPLYPLATPWALFTQHAALSIGASLAAALIGLAAGTLAHFKAKSLQSLVIGAGTLAQTVPPVAVLALLVPVLGFGDKPVLLALALYGILPVIHGTVAGLASVPLEVADAARGLGMDGTARFLRVELPLALPAIAAGLRSSVVINVGTAAIGAAMGAGGLGRPIMAGLVQFKTSYIVQGALAAVVLALTLDWILARLEAALARGYSG